MTVPAPSADFTIASKTSMPWIAIHGIEVFEAIVKSADGAGTVNIR